MEGTFPSQHDISWDFLLSTLESREFFLFPWVPPTPPPGEAGEEGLEIRCGGFRGCLPPPILCAHRLAGDRWPGNDALQAEWQGTLQLTELQWRVGLDPDRLGAADRGLPQRLPRRVRKRRTRDGVGQSGARASLSTVRG